MILMEFFSNSAQKLIGRQPQLSNLCTVFDSPQAEFIAVYGRRRVGKSFLLQKFMQQKVEQNQCAIFFFEASQRETSKNQLFRFQLEMDRTFQANVEMGAQQTNIYKLFYQLNDQIMAYKNRNPDHKVLIVLDEIQWLQKPSSNFLTTLGIFWNSYWSIQPFIKLIICGSSASFIKKKILWNKGSFYCRVTMQIILRPFSLTETREYFSANGFGYTDQEIAELYMCLGGIPYYFQRFQTTKTVHQNIRDIFFGEHAYLPNEIDALFGTLSKNSKRYLELIQCINAQTYGMTTQKLKSKFQRLSIYPYLKELEICGFIEKITHLEDGRIRSYKIVDPFIRFYFRWIQPDPPKNYLTWDQIACSDSNFRKWLGYQFELLCWLHRDQIRKALNIQVGVYDSFQWKWNKGQTGAQIDLLFLRMDGIVQVFEIKYSGTRFGINKTYFHKLNRKLQVFKAYGIAKVQKFVRTQSHQTINLQRVVFSMITSYGLIPNPYARKLVHSSLSLDDLFG